MSVLSLLEWDSLFFKKKIGKIIWDSSEPNTQLIQLLKTSQNENFKLIYVFSSLEIEDEILEDFNGQLVDTKITFGKSLIKKHQINSNINRYSSKIIAEELFHLAHLSGAYSRFKIDSNFSNQDFINLYDEWLKKSVTREIADEVFVYINQEEIVGFVTVTIENKIGQIGLIAVNPNHQGKNIGTHLLNQVENFLVSKNISELYVPTQKTNNLACQFYTKNKFNIFSNQHIYHINLK
jgi:dTDP-4-amino-4,6-dideoxy-D-galactose acyltransferase